MAIIADVFLLFIICQKDFIQKKIATYTKITKIVSFIYIKFQFKGIIEISICLELIENKKKGTIMKKKFRILSLAMGLAFVAPSVAMAADSSIDAKLANIDKKITRLEKEYKVLNSTYKDVKKSTGSSKNNDYEAKKEAVDAKLLKTSLKLDEYVTNTVPSIEAPMLGVSFYNGASLNGYTIRPQNAEDLYEYLKGYFVMKDGKNKSNYDALLRKYVNAISDKALLQDYQGITDSIYDDVRAKKAELDEAKALKKQYLIEGLEAAIEKSELAVKTANYLFENSPKTIAPVRGKLEKMVKEQEDIIRRSKKALEKYKKGL